MATRPTIEYYFSFISLWSYIGSKRLQLLAQENNAIIIYKPAYRLLEMQRWRSTRDIALVLHPRFYPADPSLAHRVLLAAIDELGHENAAVQEFARAGLETVWANETDIADESTILAVANAAGLEGSRLLERATHESLLAEREAASTQEAEEKQFFGAPIYSYRNEPFWGQDRLEMLEEVIKSKRKPIAMS